MSNRIDKHYPYWFLVPMLLVFTLFYVAPAVMGLGLSLTNARSTTFGEFVGLKHYSFLFASKLPNLLQALANTFTFAVLDVAGKVGLGTAIALLLDNRFHGRNFLRALVYVPMMFSSIVVAIVFSYILSANGFINENLRAIGLGALTMDWLGDYRVALFSVVAVDVWAGVGWTVVIVLAALQSIPQDILDAAMIDGARSWQIIRHIKLPYIRHALVLAGLLTFIYGMQAFDIIFATTRGGPGGATEVMSTFINKMLGSRGDVATASAASMILFAITVLAALIVNNLQKRYGSKAL